MFKKILLCSDGSEDVLYATRAAAVLAKRFDANVLLLDAFNAAFLEANGMGVWSVAVPAGAKGRYSTFQNQT